MRNRNIIVVGASMGGIEAVSQLLEQLPADLPAALFLVQHTGEMPSVLDEVLDRRAKLPVKMAHTNARIKESVLYVAPPGRHLLLRRSTMDLSRGPRENNFRPAIDPLFRSAALNHGARVIGVILTGYLDDGASGLHAVKQCGGVAVVQDPKDAICPDMPQAALAATRVDHVVPLVELAALLTRLVNEPAGEDQPAPASLVKEVRIAGAAMVSRSAEVRWGDNVPYSCPECGGSMKQVANEEPDRFRCHTGHAYTLRSLLEDQTKASERALFHALSLMEERVKVLNKLAQKEGDAGREITWRRYENQLQEARADAEELRRLILTGEEAESEPEEEEADLRDERRPAEL